MKILVTGGAGNVGGALARRLVENKNYFVVIADDLSTGSMEKLPSKTIKNWSFVYCDVNNYKEISEIMLVHQFDYVFHYAAVVEQRTQENPIMVLNDIEGIKCFTPKILVKRVFSLLLQKFGEPVEFVQNEETTPLNSRVPYAVVKNVGESYLDHFINHMNCRLPSFVFLTL